MGWIDRIRRRLHEKPAKSVPPTYHRTKQDDEEDEEIADLLRGPYRPNQYKDVMLPMLVLRRLDCVLAPTKEAVLAKYAELKQRGRTQGAEPVLDEITGHRFHTASRFTFEGPKGEPDTIAGLLAEMT